VIPLLSIPVLNRYDLLDTNLELIDFPIKEILIINNGTEEYIPKRKDLNIRVLNLPSNLGMSGSWNLTIKLYPHEKYWLFSSVDTHWTPGSLEKFYENSGESSVITSTEGFSCFSIGENVIRIVGLFDEKFYPYSYEDDDYRERLQSLEKKGNISPLIYRSNFIEVNAPLGPAQTIASDKKLQERYAATKEKNKKYYLLKESEDFLTIGSWDIDVRRDQEWLL
jgi:GT2 family glycosyltransferase